MSYESVEIKLITCCSCHVPFWVTAAMKSQLQESHKTFYCPAGHTNYYPTKTEAELMKEKLEVEKKIVKSLSEENVQLKKDLHDCKKQTPKQKKVSKP